MPKPFPKEFREDVIRVYRQSESSIAQVAKDFGISESCLQRWIVIDDKANGVARDFRSPELYLLAVGGTRVTNRLFTLLYRRI